MQRAQEIYEKFCKGDDLTDEDIKEGIDHYKKLAELAKQSGPIFRLTAVEANRVYLVLEDYRLARKRFAEWKASSK